jgi:hypothetical protein
MMKYVRSDSNNDDRRGQIAEVGDIDGKRDDDEAATNAHGAASSCNQKFGDGKAPPVDRPVESIK